MIDLDTAAYEAGNATRRLDDFGIELSTDAAHWLQRLHELRQNQPAPPAHNAVATLIADDSELDAIDAAIAKHVGQAHRAQQHALAEHIVGARVLDAILADSDRIHSELAVTANETIDRLHQAAAIDETITELTKQRRTDEARILACADSDAEQLRSLFYIRDEYLTPPQSDFSTGWWSCDTFKNPWEIENPQPKDDSVWAVWRAQIRAGGRLWFPTIDEARAASQAREPAELLPPMNPRRGTHAMFT